MGTQIQSETYFLRHCSSNLNRSISTGRWMSYQERKLPENSQHCDSSSPWRGLMNIYPEHEKAKVKETILEHEVTFRHQVRELHRLYRRQKEMMNAIQDNGLYKIQEKTESSQLLIFPSYVSSGRSFGLIGNGVSREDRTKDFLQERYFNSTLNNAVKYHSSTGNSQINEQSIEPDLSLHAEHRTENRKKRKIFGVEIAEEVVEEPVVSLDAFNSYPRSNGAENDTSPFLPKKAFTSHLSKMVGSPQGSHIAATSETSWLKLGSSLQSLELVGCANARDALKSSIPSAQEKSLSKYLSGMRYEIDLNLAIDEGEDPAAGVVPAVPEKIIGSEIGLQVPALIESEAEHRGTKFPENSEEAHQYLIEEAAEALVIISLAQTNDVSSFANSRLESTSNSLHWFADVISSYTSDEDVAEDLHTLAELFHSTGKIWKSSISKRNGAKYARKGMKSGESLHTTEENSLLPSKQKQAGQELELRGRSFTGWGKKTRRVPRKRCSKTSCSSIQLLTSA